MINILLDLLLCGIAEYFYELCRRASQNTNNEFLANYQRYYTILRLIRDAQIDISVRGNFARSIPRDICTRFGRYLYSTKCSGIINTITSIWHENMPGYLTLGIICSLKITVFLELRSRKTGRFSEQIKSANQYSSVFPR